MASWWRCCRRCRLQSPSKITSRNRKVVCVIVLLPLLLTLLLIPGGDIANFKYAGDTSSQAFVRTFGHHGDGSDDVVRETRSLQNKVVLLWTDFFGSRTWLVRGSGFEDCPVSTCQVTTDRSQLPQADAVLFNARALKDVSDLPQQHPPWQVWVLHNSEPPYYIYLDLPRYNNIFNWTSWYRTDADIHAPYGTYVKKNDDNSGSNSSETDYNDGNEDKGEDEGEGDDQHQQSTNNTTDRDDDVYHLHDRVLYIATSNCVDPGRRYTKVAHIQRYLPLDHFGDCGTFHCPKSHSQCQAIFAKYQFVLAFENGYCRDYVTEKLWNAYRRLQIPIVSGGADYAKVAIPGSYIDYDNFSSVAELAAYVHHVSTNPVVYNSYFSWRRHYDVTRAPVTDWCQLCEALHDKGRPPQVYSDLAGWVAQDSCPLFSRYQTFWSKVYLGIFKVLGI